MIRKGAIKIRFAQKTPRANWIYEYIKLDHGKLSCFACSLLNVALGQGAGQDFCKCCIATRNAVSRTACRVIPNA